MAADAVVTANVQECTLFGGVPTKVVKKDAIWNQPGHVHDDYITRSR